MRKIRIGNDIDVTWEVKTGGEALSLEGRSLRVYVRSAYSREEITDFTVEGCVLRFSYPAAMQKVTGARAVELVDTTNGVRTVCADLAFELVGHTGEEDSTEEDFNRYLVELKSNVLVGRPGMSAYEIWKGLGNTGSEEDFIASLKGEKGDKGDDFNGKVSMEQLPEDVRKTVQRVKKREVRYIPFKAISMNSVNDGRYENRYVYNNHEIIPLYIEKNVKRIRISVGDATVSMLCNKCFVKRANGHYFVKEYVIYSEDGEDLILPEQYDDRTCCNVYLEGFIYEIVHSNTNCAFSPISYTVDDEGLAIIKIKAIPINDNITLSRKDYKMIGGKIKYTGRVKMPENNDLICLNPYLSNEIDPVKRDVYKIVRSKNERVRKGKLYRKRNAADKNLWTNSLREFVKRHRTVYKSSAIWCLITSGEFTWTTLVTIKLDRFGHKSIWGYDKYKAKLLKLDTNDYLNLRVLKIRRV